MAKKAIVLLIAEAMNDGIFDFAADLAAGTNHDWPIEACTCPNQTIAANSHWPTNVDKGLDAHAGSNQDRSDRIVDDAGIVNGCLLRDVRHTGRAKQVGI